MSGWALNPKTEASFRDATAFLVTTVQNGWRSALRRLPPAAAGKLLYIGPLAPEALWRLRLILPPGAGRG